MTQIMDLSTGSRGDLNPTARIVDPINLPRQLQSNLSYYGTIVLEIVSRFQCCSFVLGFCLIDQLPNQKFRRVNESVL